MVIVVGRKACGGDNGGHLEKGVAQSFAKATEESTAKEGNHGGGKENSEKIKL